MWQRCTGVEFTLLVVKTTCGEIFGACATTPWHSHTADGHSRGTFFGRGNSWLWRLGGDGAHSGDGDDTVVVRYDWSRADNAFQHLSADGLALGAGRSGGGGYGLWLSADLQTGSSTPSDTFSSPCLLDGGSTQKTFVVAGAVYLCWTRAR